MSVRPATLDEVPWRWWAIAAGGAVGTAARAGLLWAWPASDGPWPATLFAENAVGAFALGVLLGWLGRRGGIAGWHGLFFGTGVLGSFTTFSTLTAEVVRVAADRPAWAAAVAVASVAVGLAAAAAGMALGRVGRRG